MTSKEDAKQDHLTLHNGTIISNNKARQRIIARLRLNGVPLEDARQVADYQISDPWHHGLLVSYLENTALKTWTTGEWRS